MFEFELMTTQMQPVLAKRFSVDGVVVVADQVVLGIPHNGSSQAVGQVASQLVEAPRMGMQLQSGKLVVALHQAPFGHGGFPIDGIVDRSVGRVGCSKDNGRVRFVDLSLGKHGTEALQNGRCLGHDDQTVGASIEPMDRPWQERGSVWRRQDKGQQRLQILSIGFGIDGCHALWLAQDGHFAVFVHHKVGCIPKGSRRVDILGGVHRVADRGRNPCYLVDDITRRYRHGGLRLLIVV